MADNPADEPGYRAGKICCIDELPKTGIVRSAGFYQQPGLAGTERGLAR